MCQLVTRRGCLAAADPAGVAVGAPGQPHLQPAPVVGEDRQHGPLLGDRRPRRQEVDRARKGQTVPSGRRGGRAARRDPGSA